jgi:hypothetical protein
MTAVNEDALSVAVGDVYIASRASVTALDDTMSNAATVITALDALSYERMASVVDVAFSVDTSTNQVKVETDDTGLIYQAYRPESKIVGTWYESGDIDVIKKLLGVNVLDVAGSPASKIYGQNLTTKALPKLVVKIVGRADAAGKKNIIYLYDSAMNSEIMQSFADIARAGDIKGSPFEFIGNKGGFWLVKANKY